MTGWRIGYAAGPAKLIGAMNKVQSQSTSNPTSISQVAAEAALNGGRDCVLPMVKAFKERHDFLIKGLNEIKGFSCIPADGAFYAYPNVKEAMKLKGCNNDIEFAELLLNEAGVALVPGSAFGTEGYMRLSYATSMDVLTDALARIKVMGNAQTLAAIGRHLMRGFLSSGKTKTFAFGGIGLNDGARHKAPCQYVLRQGFSIQRWMARFNGRAPKMGS